jgi:hypothetical protein
MPAADEGAAGGAGDHAGPGRCEAGRAAAGSSGLAGGSAVKKLRIWRSASKVIGTANHAKHANGGGGL